MRCKDVVRKRRARLEEDARREMGMRRGAASVMANPLASG